MFTPVPGEEIADRYRLEGEIARGGMGSVWAGRADKLQSRRGRGCTYCNGTGYQGRIGVYEYLELDEALIEALHSGDPLKFTTAAKHQPGYQGLKRSAIALAAQGHTTMDQVMRVTYGIEE